MPATDLDTIADAFRTAIQGITPRIVDGRDSARWKFYEGERRPSTDARRVRLEWDGEGFTPSGFFGPVQCDMTAIMILHTDYGGFAAHRIKVVAEDDQQQVHDVLRRLIPTLPGFLNITMDGWDFAPGVDQNSGQIQHRFLVRYMKARA